MSAVMETPNRIEYIPSNRYNILIEFAHRHLDFQHPELESILSMHNITIGSDDCRIIPLPNQTEGRRRAFLILSFPKTGFPSLANFYDDDENDDDVNMSTESNNTDTSGKNATTHQYPKNNKNKKLPTIASILSRCILVRAVVELWSCGNTIPECASNLSQFYQTNKTNDDRKKSSSSSLTHFIERHSSRSWKMTVHTFGTRHTRDEHNAMRRYFSFLPFDGPVKMEGNDEEYVLIREVEVDEMGSLIVRGDGKKGGKEDCPPLASYFGRILGNVRDLRKGQLERISLKRRKYLGPTSMDAELSVVMTSLGQVKKGSFCFDPFAGTGSILLTCALQGAYCFGTDIDIRVLRGKGVDENILSNFIQYNLPRPELIRSDNSLYHRHFRTHRPLFDAIVTDPPYGIRAGARQCGVRDGASTPIKEVPDHHRDDHIARTKPYAVSDVMADLLDVAARTLVMRGRLVYIVPAMMDFDPVVDLPRNECLRLVHCCYQPLQMNLGRRMVVMEKVKEYCEIGDREEYLKSVWVNGPESADKVANIREKLLEAAKLKPGYEEKAAIRKMKRRATKEERKKAKKRDTASTNNPPSLTTDK